MYNFELEVVNEEDQIVETVINKDASVGPGSGISKNISEVMQNSNVSQNKTSKSHTPRSISHNSSLQHEYAEEDSRTFDGDHLDDQEALPIGEHASRATVNRS